MKLVSMLLILTLLPGCALLRVPETGQSVDGLGTRYGGDAAGLARTAADELASRYAPAHTEFSLSKAPGVFGDNLEHELRRKGFAVGDDVPGTVRVSYAVDELRGDVRPVAYARIQISDGRDGQDGHAFSLVRHLGMPVPAAPVDVTAATLSVSKLPEESLTPKGKDSESALETPALPLSPSPKPQNLIPLSRGVLTVLPARWKYTIPDVPKRSVQVEKAAHLPWRESIQRMAEDAGCTASFDEAARRVTIRAGADQSSAVAMTPPVSVPSVATGSADSQHPLEPAAPPVTSSLPPEDTKRAAPVVSAALASLPVSPAQSSVTPPAETPAASSLSTYVSPPVAAVWELKPGSLASQLETWSIRAGFQLIWKAPHDLEMEAHSVFRGEFQDAVSRLFQGLHKSGNALRVTIYTANNVIEVAED